MPGPARQQDRQATGQQSETGGGGRRVDLRGGMAQRQLARQWILVAAQDGRDALRTGDP
jgi:hypothetical protein